MSRRREEWRAGDRLESLCCVCDWQQKWGDGRIDYDSAGSALRSFSHQAWGSWLCLIFVALVWHVVGNQKWWLNETPGPLPSVKVGLVNPFKSKQFGSSLQAMVASFEKLGHQSVDTKFQDVPLVYLSDPDNGTTPLWGHDHYVHMKTGSEN